ncbi:SRPBCC domain-containing protein [Kribbella sp. NPDC003505]|uniref:SRPBCC family protein n=1 Tax=Kribbella sp. NPDC003505 TaxID=3154448 RepID=UPI0033B30F82
MFTLQQTVDAPPTEVVRAFTEPEPFAAWFVAEGLSTPADRVTLDVRPGGLISAVFVGPEAEIPFTLRFGELDLPRHLVLHFDDPAEEITVDLADLPGGRTRLDYRSVGLSDEQQASIEPGVATMLGHLAAYFTR